ncbi:methionine--tRNA ligase [Roseomonas alkaliterrae]|uniref:Methionine--tRNA ligase n=1 Tax=Neoroseomonas alkaliterrae TaxID=1452450 RepID=A0A840Y4Y2_9PROT|nr:methionine--tRNA ligase [Neoroseomonas alkaliterrae]MBB5691031.1 methionyl-tRNA synthetase [Neoroseomonas alkaliterrae]MBR0674706.1 methionine--tRNA ligase [Neoroseomonas alkaliterrae]
MAKPPIYLTTPIYYVNDKPHIGHAYTSLATDVLARFKRLDGHEVFFLTGTDEHGQKVEKAAQEAGEDPQAFTDRVSQAFRDLTVTMGFSNDDFIRTTEARHKAACVALWQVLAERGEIYLGDYEGWYAVRDEAFYGPDELTERDGVRYAPSGAPVEWVREPSYFFRLSKWLPELLRRYDLPEGHPERIDIQPESRRNEIRAFIQQGLKDFADRPEKLDLSVSRTSFTWGVKVPGDPAHVMYVWLDALTNYITAVGYPDTHHPRWKFWPADVHFVGKDIVRFHTIYWPAFLMAAGIAPPRRVFAHGWWTNEGQKISKSLGNVIDPVALVAEYGLDPVRYFLLREVPFGQDGDFSRKALVNRLNGELADALGNLANRTLSLIQRNCEGRLPADAARSVEDAALFASVDGVVDTLRKHLDQQHFHSALEAIFASVREANAYITRQAPWALRKTDPARMAAVLRHLHTALRCYATALQPFMPGTMAALLDQLGVPRDARHFAALDDPLPEGTPLPPPSPLFRKIELPA